MAWELGLAEAVAPPVALRDDAEGYETDCSFLCRRPVLLLLSNMKSFILILLLQSLK